MGCGMRARLFLHCSKTHPSITPRSAKFGARCRFRRGAFVQGSCRRVSNHFRIAGLSYVIPAGAIGGLREPSHCCHSISEDNDRQCLLACTLLGSACNHLQCIEVSRQTAVCKPYKGGRSCPLITQVCVGGSFWSIPGTLTIWSQGWLCHDCQCDGAFKLLRSCSLIILQLLGNLQGRWPMCGMRLLLPPAQSKISSHLHVPSLHALPIESTPAGASTLF